MCIKICFLPQVYYLCLVSFIRLLISKRKERSKDPFVCLQADAKILISKRKKVSTGENLRADTK